MTIKKTLFVLTLAAAFESAFAEGFLLNGNIQTQASKSLYDNDKENNLDGFWFRANIGGAYSSEDFDAKLTLRMYAPNFNNGADKLQADTYYGNYKWKSTGLNLKFGHWKTDTDGAGNFGAYLDKNISKRGFLGRDYSHDAFELGLKTDWNQFNVMIGTCDGNFNRGYIRLNDDLKLGNSLKLGFGYRVNAIDPIQYSAVLTHAMNIRAKYNIAKQFSVYGEFAAILTGEDKEVNGESIEAGYATSPVYAQDSRYFPFYIGVEIPTAGIFDKAFAEVEYIKDRDELNANADALGWSAGIVKKIGSRSKAQVSLYSENEISDIAVSARITTTIQ